MRRCAIVLLVAGSAAAEPTGSIHGRVLDPDGKGVRCIVRAHSLMDEVLKGLGEPAATDKDGSYLIEGLPPGEYALDVMTTRLPKPGEKSTMGHLLKNLEPVPVVGGQPQRVIVRAGQRVEHDFRVARTLAVTLAVTRDGKPLADTPVRLELLDKNGIPVVLVQKLEPRRTDARGEIEFPGTAEGSYSISVFVGDWEIAWGAVEAAGEGPMRVPVAIGTRRARLKVVDAGGKPVVSARPAMRADGGHRVGPKDRRMASATGVYEIPCLRDGRYTPTASVDAVFAKGEPVDIAPGSADPEITLTLPPSGSLLVRVTDRGGKPLEGCMVTVEPPSGIPSLSFDTDAKGEIRVRYLPVGKWTVEILDPPARRDVEIKASAEAKVIVRP